MPFVKAHKIVVKAHEKEREAKQWDLYLTKYPWMTDDDFVSFEDFRRYIDAKTIKRKQKKMVAEKPENILADVKNILDEHASKRSGGPVQ